MEQVRILFVCSHNSGRSQMAEAFVNGRRDPQISAESAGLEAGTLNPFVVESMRAIGFDISGNKTKTVASILATGRAYDCVVTVCGNAAAERCPIFPGKGKRLHWDLPDPAAVIGSPEEILIQIGAIRDRIRENVEELCSALKGGPVS